MRDKISHELSGYSWQHRVEYLPTYERTRKRTWPGYTQELTFLLYQPINSLGNALNTCYY